VGQRVALQFLAKVGVASRIWSAPRVPPARAHMAIGQNEYPLNLALCPFFRKRDKPYWDEAAQGT
jgi:hypothetical protein